MKASIVIRTYNEAQYLHDLLTGIAEQQTDFDHETVLVDSGSNDLTLDIARRHKCRIAHIRKQDFSFGRSLNLGCRMATGECLVFVSGHCIPASSTWLTRLLSPLGTNSIVYSYGSQLGNGESKFSECQLFHKYYPSRSQLPQEGFYCNNANAAMLRSVWMDHPFDEELTGLEDMHLARKLVEKGLKVGYVSDASVYHLHHESWAQVKRRFEREAIALQHIMPEVQVNFLDFIRYFCSAVLLDSGAALQQHALRSKFREIFMYRLMQFWGTYRGNHLHRRISKERKERYFYPR